VDVSLKRKANNGALVAHIICENVRPSAVHAVLNSDIIGRAIYGRCNHVEVELLPRSAKLQADLNVMNAVNVKSGEEGWFFAVTIKCDDYDSQVTCYYNASAMPMGTDDEWSFESIVPDETDDATGDFVDRIRVKSSLPMFETVASHARGRLTWTRMCLTFMEPTQFPIVGGADVV
jgi:hypothetical protein